MNRTIGIIGFGNMGSAIAEQLKADYKILAFDKDPAKLAKPLNFSAAVNIQELLTGSEVIILAVKPQDIRELLAQIKIPLGDKLFISIAAGISTAYLEKILGVARVVRAMPNMPAKIAQGVTCLSKGKFASEEDCEFAQNIFSYLGEVLEIDESLMNAATAVSGSGPAYVCDFLEASGKSAEDFLRDFKLAAESVGFNKEQAEFLVKNTFAGTLAFIKQAKLEPSELKKQVASKGGTTEAALKILSSKGSLKEAVLAAKNRAEELSKKE